MDAIPPISEDGQVDYSIIEGQLLSYIWKLIEYSVQFNHLQFVRISFLEANCKQILFDKKRIRT